MGSSPRRTPVIPLHPDAAPRSAPTTPDKVRESLNVGSPGGNAAGGVGPHTIFSGTKTTMPLDRIRPYDRNPRRSINAARREIKASLAATGPSGPDIPDLIVTQRPGTDYYMPYRGGNTCLDLMKELVQEGDARWSTLTVLVMVWTSDADVLTQHLIENVNRSDMSFWDKAVAYVVEMRAQIEHDTGRPVSIRKLEEELDRRGVGVGKSVLHRFQFAVERLAKVGPYLSGVQVDKLQPTLNLMAHLASRFGIEDAAFQAMLDRALDLHRLAIEAEVQAMQEDEHEARDRIGFRADAFLPEMEVALAKRLETTVPELRRWMDTLARFPDETAESLRTPPPPPPGQAPGRAPPADTRGHDGVSTGDGATALPSPSGAHNEGVGGTGHDPAPEEHPATDYRAAPNQMGLPGLDTPPVSVTATLEIASTGPLTPALAASTLAEAAGVRDCLRPCALSTGFYMELPSEPIDQTGAQSTNRIAAWQLLAALSGQWSADQTRLLPAESLWRRMRLCEGGLDADALPYFTSDQLLAEVGGTPVPGAEDLGWGPAISLNWITHLLTDPECLGPVIQLLQIFKREAV